MDAERREYLEMQLSAYLDGELTPQEVAEVEEWLASDPQAERLLAGLRATVEAVHSLPRARASEELLGNLRTRLERQALLEISKPAEVVTRTPALSWGKWVAAAAVIGLTFVAGYFTWTLRNEHQPAGPQFALQEADKLPNETKYNELTYSPEGEKDKRYRSLASRLEGDRNAEEVAPSAATPLTPPASPAAKPAELPGKRLATADRPTTEDLYEHAHLGIAEGKAGVSAGAAVALDAAIPEEANRAGAVVRRALSDEARPATPGTMAVASGERLDESGFGRVASGPIPSDGRTQVMTFAFADADRRAKAIESLRRRVLLKETDAPAEGGRQQAARSYQPSAQPQREVAREPQAAAEAPAAAPSRSASASTRPASQFRSSVADFEKAKEHQVSHGQELGGSNLVGMGENESLFTGQGQIEPIQVDRDAPVNVLLINTSDNATAERLIAALGDQARRGVVERHRHEGTVADAGTLRGGAGDDILRGEASGRLGGFDDLGAPHALKDKAAGGVRDDADGDGAPDQAVGSDGLDLSPAYGKSLGQKQAPGGLTSTMPSAGEGVVTWNVTPFTPTDGQKDWADAPPGVANGVVNLNLHYDEDAQMGGNWYGEASNVPATSPAGSPQTRYGYSNTDRFSKGDTAGKMAMGGAGMMGAGGIGGFGSFGGYGGGSATAPAAPAASQPASRPSQRQPGENLLVVYFRVVPPETQPADRLTASAPSLAAPASQPANRP